MKQSTAARRAQSRERTQDGLLLVREGMPERWHYSVAIEDHPASHVYRGRITVMFDGSVKCHLMQTQLADEEEEAVEAARTMVLAWIRDYQRRNGLADPTITPAEPTGP